MSKPIALVIASEDFRDEEYFDPKTQLENAGYEIHTVSGQTGPCKGMLGGTAYADHRIDSIKAENYQAMVFIGGGGAREYYHHPEAHRLVHESIRSGIILAAVCIAPIILANAGVLNQVHATCFKSEQGELARLGAICTGRGVERDQRILTAAGPAFISEFSSTLIQMLKL
ncbi:MAG: DJ-1/PfpI family protein [Candidatus Delongbacteria bacterium]|nr:DJ-1/PfpI family protein [Candidatus Delongbacteria bacterium]